MASKAALIGHRTYCQVLIWAALAHEYCPVGRPVRLKEIDDLNAPWLRHFQVYVVALHGAREEQRPSAFEYDFGGVQLGLGITHTSCFLNSLRMLVKHLL